MLVNPLRDNGIIGSRSGDRVATSLCGNDLDRRRWSGSPECLAFVQVRAMVLVTHGGVWNPGHTIEGLKYRSGR